MYNVLSYLDWFPLHVAVLQNVRTGASVFLSPYRVNENQFISKSVRGKREPVYYLVRTESTGTSSFHRPHVAELNLYKRILLFIITSLYGFNKTWSWKTCKFFASCNKWEKC